MKADKTLSIKVKSKSERRIKEEPEIEMISEWNLKRIITALIIFLILIIIILAYSFSQLDDQDAVNDIAISKQTDEPAVKLTSTRKSTVPEQSPSRKVSKDTIVEEDTAVLLPNIKPIESSESEIVIETTNKEPVTQEKPETEVLNQHITQARLARWVKEKEPHGQVNLPLQVGDSNAEGFYYFTDINNMQGNTVFHEWLREGKSIYKRKFIIKGERARMSTSKLFTFRTTGQWQVRLITDQGEVLHKIDFSVENK